MSEVKTVKETEKRTIGKLKILVILLLNIALLDISLNTAAQPVKSKATATPGTVCAGQTVQLDAGATGGTGPLTYTWTSNPAGFNSSDPAPTDIPSVNTTYMVSVTDGVTTDNSQVDVIVNPLLPAGVSIVASPSGPICAGTQVTFTATPVNGGSPSYQWKINSSNTGTNSATFSSTALANNDIVTVVMTSTATCETGSPVTSNAITMTVNPVLTPSVTIAASPAGAVCSGTSVTFTATPVNGGAPVYQWKVNGAAVGSNSPTYNSSTLSNGDVVTVMMTSSFACTSVNPVTSNAITMVVNAVIPVSVSIAASPSGAICPGTSVTFTATPVNGGTPVYQWKLNGNNVGTNSSSYTSSTLNNNDVVAVVMTSNISCATGSPATSNAITMTVNPPLPVSVSIASLSVGTICTGSSASFTATPVNGGSLPAYQWKVNGVNAGINSSSFSYVPANNDVVTCVLTSNASCATNNPATSNSIIMTVAPSVGTPATPTPSATTICQGSSSTSYTTSAVNAASYNWTVTGTGNTISGTGTTGTVSWSPTYSGTATISVTANGCNGPSASASTTVDVLPSPVATISGTTSVCRNATPPNITFNNPQSLPVTITYNINGANQSTINAGANSTATIAVPTSSAGAFAYNLVSVAYQTGPSCSNAVTGTATVTVNALPAITLTSSDADNIICTGTSVTFTATAGMSNYNFRVGGVSVQDGSLAAFTTSTLTNGQYVDVVVTNSNGCEATSSSILNLVNQIPFITISSPPACSVDLTTYSLVIVSSGTVISTAGTVSNTGTNTWTISGIPSGTNIIVTVTGSNGCQNMLDVTAPNCACPAIMPPVSLGDKAYCESEPVPSISVSVTAGETVDWYDSSSGGNLLQSGSLSYSPPAAGIFYAIARNTTTGCVSSTRTPVTVTMNALPLALLSSSDADNTFCSGDAITFTAGGGTNYDFRIDGLSVQNGTSSVYITSALTNGQAVDVTVTNGNGCSATSSPIVNTVSSLPVPTLISSDTDNIFCAGASITFTAGGGSAYNFRVNGISNQNSSSNTFTINTLNNGDIVDVEVSNAGGCTANSPGITNTVYDLPVPTLASSDADNVFCAGTSITFTASGGVTYDFRTDGLISQSGTLSTFTTSSLTNGQVVDVVAYNTTGDCPVTSAGIVNTVTVSPVADAGTGGNGCDLNYSFNAVPSIGTGTWSLTSGPGTATFSPDANSPTATVTVTEYGAYIFAWTEVSGSCTSSSTITVTFYRQPVANPGTGGNNCGLEFYLNAILSEGTGTWTKISGPGNVTFSPDANTPGALVTVSAFGSYTFSWAVVNGTCSNSATVNVNFIELMPSSAGAGGEVCDKEFVFNGSSANGTGTWTKVSGPGNATFTPDSHQPNSKVTVDMPGTYNFAWTIVNSSCTSSDVVVAVFRDPPAIDAGKDTTICTGSNIRLNAQGSGTFIWKPSKLVSDSTIFNPVVTPVSTTTFSVTITDQYGCKNSDDIVVVVSEKIKANAGPDQDLGYVFSSNMDAVLAQPNESGIWSVLSGTGEFTDATDPGSTVTGFSVGENDFLWTVSNGICLSSSDTVKITVNNLVIPTLITPNMDGINDYFVLRGLQTLGTTELLIFDRRGAQVYKNLKYDNSWNGVDYNGNALPEDTYFYIIKTESGKSLSGYIVIRR